MEDKPSIHNKGRYQLKYRGVECNNCGHPLDISDRFCPNCSQANSTKKLTIKDFVDEFFSSLISYDSKLLKTLSALLLRPGRITKDYIAGKRVSYTNPFRFLLSLGIVYFLMLNFSGDFESWDNYGANKNGSWFKSDGSLNIGTDISLEDNEELTKTLDSLHIGENIIKSDSIILSNSQKKFDSLKSKGFFTRVFKQREFFSAVFRTDQIFDYDQITEKYHIEDTRSTRYAYSAARSMSKLQQRPGSFISSVISKLPFAIFFLLPAFALFIWLIYIRKKYNYTDHLIFSFHNQSLLFILLIISYLIDAIFDVYSSWIFILIFGIYLFKSMWSFYQQGFIKTLIKYVFLNIVFFTLALFTTVLLITGSVYTY